MSEIINGYELLEPFQNQDAGFSRWTFARKNGKEYFLKQFMEPVYPQENTLSEELRKSKIRECEEIEVRKKLLYREINEASDGNIVRINEFFRFDTHYYLATEKIEKAGLKLEDIIKYPYENRLLLCKSLAHGVSKLHRAHIAHSDIKDTNVIIKTSGTGQLIAKLIDFDAAFFDDKPPVDEDELSGDQIYLAPEACLFIFGDPVRLGTKIDVFALGLLFHQYLSGEFPKFDEEKYDYAYESVLDDQPLLLSEKIPGEMRAVIEQMLVCKPEERISMQAVYEKMKSLEREGKEVTESETAEGNTVKHEEKVCAKDESFVGFYTPGDDDL